MCVSLFSARKGLNKQQRTGILPLSSLDFTRKGQTGMALTYYVFKSYSIFSGSLDYLFEYDVYSMDKMPMGRPSLIEEVHILVFGFAKLPWRKSADF